jgi:tRNA(Ile)-lysidine synthase
VTLAVVEVSSLDKLDETLKRLLGRAGHHEEPLVVAVSGGVDSMVLLTKVAEFTSSRGISCVAAHVDHGLRPESASDAVFVRNAAKALNVDFLMRRISPGVLPFEVSQGIEADARVLRHQLLREMAVQANSPFLLFAHHADDQLETLLWRLMRGTSRTGLAAMRDVRRAEGVVYLRPLLSVSKRDLEMFAQSHAISFVEDASNRSSDYMRNRIRHSILPTMYELAPTVAKQTSTLMQVMQDENDYLDGLATELLDRCREDQSDTSATIAVVPLLREPLPLQRRAIHILLYCLTPLDWTFAHTESILRLARSTGPSGSVSLPASWCAWREYDVLRIGRCNPTDVGPVMPGRRWLLGDGATVNWHTPTGESWEFTCRALTPTTERKRANRFETCVPEVAALQLQTEESSLRIQPLGLHGHRKLQDCFVDAKVPRRLRPVWPIVYIGNSLVWVPGVVRTNDYQVQEGADSGWLLTCHFEEKQGGPHASRS